MRFRHVLAVTAVALLCTALVQAQEQERGQRGQPGQRGQRGGGGFQGGFGQFGGFGGGFGGTSRLRLLAIAEVQKELELVDEQVTAITKVREELQPQRGGFGERGRGRGGEGGEGGRGRRGGGDNPGGKANPPPQGASLSTAERYLVQQEAQPPQRGERGQRGGGFGQLTEEQRADFEKQRLEREKQEKAKLAEILLPHQMKRLNEIYYQQLGDRVVEDADVVAALKITDEQKEKLAKVREENRAARQAMTREMFQNRPEGTRGEGGRGRGGFGFTEEQQAKLDEASKKDTEKLLAVLSDAQRKQLDELKGKPFEMPENAGRGRGGAGGGGAPGGRGRGGDNPRPNPNP